MRRRQGLLVLALAGAAACNALSGAADLGTGCPDCDRMAPEGGLADAIIDGAAGDVAVDSSPAPCVPGPPTCNGDSRVTCVAGKEVATPCVAPTAVCVGGACAAMYPSCGGAGGDGGTGLDCGPATGNQDCCASLAVPGGSFLRRNDTKLPATLSAFKLDRFEVTVGRFRAFVNAGMGTQASPPPPGAGAHPKIAGSGWNSAWNGALPSNGTALRLALVNNAGGLATWTDAVEANELLPINNVTFFLAFAFCAWDGGRLPTEAELEFAAAGGSEQRIYPWGDTAPSSAAPDSFAVFNCNASPPAYDSTTGSGCAFADLVPVGSRSPKGDGRFGQADLGGSVADVTLDKRDGVPASFCVDCARIVGAFDTNKSNIALGGSFRDSSGRLRTTEEGSTGNLSQPTPELGIRCAR